MKEGGTAKSGTVSKRPQPEPVEVGSSIANVDDVPPCPEFLSAEARDVWHEIVVALVESNLLSSVDVPAISVLCEQFGRWRKAIDAVDRPVDSAELDSIAKRLREHALFVNAVRASIANKAKAGVEIKPGEIKQLGDAEQTLVNLETYLDYRKRYGNMVVLGSTGQIRENPMIGVSERAASLFLRYAAEYGLTALARTRLGLNLLAGRSLAADLRSKLGSSGR